MEAPLSKAAFGDWLNVSRETLDRLDTYLTLLQKWQAKVNLVGARTLEDPWRRHMADSAQLLRFLPPGSQNLVDVGSGAGFPGLVLAVLGVRNVTLIDSDQRKGAFLREVARVTETAVDIRSARVEEITDLKADVLTARAFAPLNRLLTWTTGLRHSNTVGLLLKGRAYEEELTDARKEWSMSVERHKSAGHDDSVILVLKDIRHVDASAESAAPDHRRC